MRMRAGHSRNINTFYNDSYNTPILLTKSTNTAAKPKSQ